MQNLFFFIASGLFSSASPLSSLGYFIGGSVSVFMKVRSLVEAPSKPTFGSLLPFPRRSVWRQNRSSCLSFSLHAESARV